LPADFEVALQGVDTRLKALQPGTTLGDIAYSSATANTNTRLGIGTSGQVLAVSGGGVPAWTTTADVTPLTTKGDLFTFDTADARLGVGTNGQTLVADGTASTGLKWATPAAGGGMTLLSTTTISGDTTISSIDQTYTNLFVTVTGLTNVTASNSQVCLINGVTGNVLGGYFGTNNTAITLDFTTPSIFIGGMASASYSQYNSTANAFTLIFNNYASTTTHKNWSLIAGYLNASSVRATVFGAGEYSSNTAISSLLFKGATYALNGGTIKVYGVK
jgi:hypothetical protein